MSQQPLAHGGGVRGQEGSDLECLGAVVGTEDVVDDQHVAVVHRAQANALVVVRAASQSGTS